VSRSLNALAALLLLTAACGNKEDNEARLFLDRSELVTLDAPVAERERMIEALEALPLENEEVIEVRQACTEGHRALIEAETAQREATVELDRVSGGDENARIPQAEAARIQAIIERSNAAIQESGERLEACEDGKRRLRRSIGGQH
jgi:hypothetical protein